MKSFSMFLEISLYSISSGIWWINYLWWIIDFQIEIWGVSGPCVSVGRVKSLYKRNYRIGQFPFYQLDVWFAVFASVKVQNMKYENCLTMYTLINPFKTLQKDKYFNFIFSERFEIRHATFLWKIRPLSFSKVTRVHDRLIFGGKTFLVGTTNSS